MKYKTFLMNRIINNFTKMIISNIELFIDLIKKFFDSNLGKGNLG